MPAKSIVLAFFCIAVSVPMTAVCQKATTLLPGTWSADLTKSRESLRDPAGEVVARAIMSHLLKNETVDLRVDKSGDAMFLTKKGSQSGEWPWKWRFVKEDRSKGGNPVLVARLTGGPTDLILKIEYLDDDEIVFRLGKPAVRSRWRRSTD